MSNDWLHSFTIPVASRAPNNRLLGQTLGEYLFRNGTRGAIGGLWLR
jgi:hypothetical protein